MYLNLFNFWRSQLFFIGTAIALYIGWLQRDDNYISAETGAGYLLGILGGSLMLILLLYPVSKRVAFFTRLMPIRYWFGFHMILGVVGPLLILFHSNFHFGSTNSSIALICMLLVAGSGLIGRYFYTHIHHGLYGARITLKELKQNTENSHTKILDLYAMDETLTQRLDSMEKKALQPYSSLTSGLVDVMSLAVNARRLKSSVLRQLKASAKKDQTNTELPNPKHVAQSINRYTLALRRAAAFKLYERLFSLWHILHLPLFFMMIITGVIHIFAVHIY